MIKVRLNLRKVATIVACLAVTSMMFSGCGKDDEDTPKDPPKDPLTYEEGVVINGVKWSTRNLDEVGTFALTPESAGKFYQWNRKKAWNTTDSIVSGWDSTISEGTKWEKTNDPSPAGWRVPTLEEMEKLLDTDKVENEWIVRNGVVGRKFTDNTNGNSIFFPAAGYRMDNDGKLNGNGGIGGVYWSCTMQNDSKDVYYLSFTEDVCIYYILSRNWGSSVRCVAE